MRITMRPLLSVTAFVLLGSVCALAGTSGVPPVPPMMRGLEIDEKVNRGVDLSLTFLAEDGSEHALSEYFHKGRPVIINLVYYACPSLCNMVLNGESQTMKEIPWNPGTEYELVTISIDPREKPEDAARKRETYVKSFGRPAPGWHFLADTRGHSKMLADQLGFKYRFDEKKNQYVHPAAIMVLTPEGKVARYLYGYRFKSFDMRMAVTEASEGKGRFSLEKALLLCYSYDPKAKSYVVFAQNLMRGSAGLMVMLLSVALWRFWSREKKRTAEIEANRPASWRPR